MSVVNVQQQVLTTERNFIANVSLNMSLTTNNIIIMIQCANSHLSIVPFYATSTF